MKISFFLTLLVLSSCTTTPTGRSQFKLVDDDKMAKMGDDSYKELKKKTPLSTDSKQIAYVMCVSETLLKAIGKDPKKWEIKVFKDDSANAFALPGNNIGVHTGMLKIATDQAELAAVIGHEIAHVEADHGNERVSQNMIVQGGMAATALVLSTNPDNKNSGLILAGLGVGAQFGFLLPFSRKHESEADILGLEYMARAGFNPQGAVDLWKKMAKMGDSPAQFLSTHPNPENRVTYLQEEIKKVRKDYESVKNKPNCRL